MSVFKSLLELNLILSTELFYTFIFFEKFGTLLNELRISYSMLFIFHSKAHIQFSEVDLKLSPKEETTKFATF